MRIFPFVVAFAGAANGQSDTSCLLQAGDKTALSAKQRKRQPVPSPDRPNFTVGDRLPICITGQIGRLELRTKVQHLIQPAVDEGHRVEVYLVLDPRPETTFIHRPPGTNVGNYTIVGGNFTALNETVSLFPRDVPVILDPFIPQDYPTDERYANLLMKTNEAGNPLILQVGKLNWAKKRAKSHMRQWEMFARCWELFQKTDAPPKVAMRIRDDLVFVAPFEPKFETLQTGIHVDACEGCGGLNDKLAVLSGPGVVASYFTQPLLLMRDDFGKVLSKRAVANPETVLYSIMQLSQIKAHTLDAPCYRATMLRDAESRVHLCYLYSADSRTCFPKIWPVLKDKTTPVFASKQPTMEAKPSALIQETSAHLMDGFQGRQKQALRHAPIFLQSAARRWAKSGATQEAAKRARFQEYEKKMIQLTSSANRRLFTLRHSYRKEEEPAFVCEQ